MLLEHFRIDYHDADGHAVLPHRNVQPPPFTKLGGSPFVFGAFRLTRSVSTFVCYSSTAACAAAKRAMGTRKGVHEA